MKGTLRCYYKKQCTSQPSSPFPRDQKEEILQTRGLEDTSSSIFIPCTRTQRFTQQIALSSPQAVKWTCPVQRIPEHLHRALLFSCRGLHILTRRQVQAHQVSIVTPYGSAARMLCTATQSAKSHYIMLMNLACPPGFTASLRGHCQLSEHKKVDVKESAGGQVIQTIQVCKKERYFNK